MEVKIYVDVLFIINFIIDYILLSVTSFFVKKTPKIFKMCLSASMGAVYSATVFFIPMSTFVSLPFSAAVAFLMVAIAFGVNKASLLLKNTAIFYLVCAVTAGFGFSLVFAGKAGTNYAVNNGIFYADINAYTLLFIFIISVATIHIATGYIKKQKIKSGYLYTVTIEKDGRRVSDTALFDSGNFLTDPISQKSVVIAEWQSVSGLFSENKITEAIVANPSDFLYIGCKGLGDVTGMYAFTPDKISSSEMEFSDPVLIAVTEMSLDKEGSYRMLLPNTATIRKGFNNGQHI